MIILEAVIHETVWGGNRLNTFAERDHAGTDAVKTGHLYLLNGHKGSVKLIQHYPKEIPVILFSLSMRISEITDRHSVRFSSRVSDS